MGKRVPWKPDVYVFRRHIADCAQNHVYTEARSHSFRTKPQLPGTAESAHDTRSFLYCRSLSPISCVPQIGDFASSRQIAVLLLLGTNVIKIALFLHFRFCWNFQRHGSWVVQALCQRLRFSDVATLPALLHWLVYRIDPTCLE